MYALRGIRPPEAYKMVAGPDSNGWYLGYEPSEPPLLHTRIKMVLPRGLEPLITCVRGRALDRFALGSVVGAQGLAGSLSPM